MSDPPLRGPSPRVARLTLCETRSAHRAQKIRVIMAGVYRTRAVNRCPDCNEVLKEKDGMVTCAYASRNRRVVQAEKGTPVEETWLADNGFEFAQDAAGDLYYVGPLSHIIHLYPNRKWDSDKAPGSCGSLEEYFAWLAPSKGCSALDRRPGHIADSLRGPLRRVGKSRECRAASSRSCLTHKWETPARDQVAPSRSRIRFTSRFPCRMRMTRIVSSSRR
jgi:hypothetical protein